MTPETPPTLPPRKKLVPRGITVNDRLIVYAKAKGKKNTFYTQEHRSEIGQQCRDVFFRDPTHKNWGARRITIVEPDGNTYRVIAYPERFCPVMDAIINSYFTLKGNPRRKKKS